ncbi:LysR family transcriptional regulator [Parasphingorhabdus litoris]|uniref:LysR family transcriptional regulator n=1 Tax=Parasphingorhabdus litoris TaxID=394733 RepID=A0ABN1B0M9_9SPHN
MDRLTLLETFIRIAERGSISAAARDLGLSQASASRQLSDLEDRLGVQLITRTTHSLALTSAGKACLEKARDHLTSWSLLVETFANEAHVMQGSLRVVAPVALGQKLLADTAASFQASFPDVRIDWILEDENIRFSEMGCDLWIKVGPVPDETLIVKPIISVKRIIVASPQLITSKDQTPDTLADLPFAALSPFEGGHIPLTDKAGSKQSFRPSVSFTTNNIFAVHRAILSGQVTAVMPEWLVREDLIEGRLLNTLPDWRAPDLPVNIAYAPANRQTVRLKKFVEEITSSLEALV